MNSDFKFMNRLMWGMLVGQVLVVIGLTTGGRYGRFTCSRMRT